MLIQDVKKPLNYYFDKMKAEKEWFLFRFRNVQEDHANGVISVYVQKSFVNNPLSLLRITIIYLQLHIKFQWVHSIEASANPEVSFLHFSVKTFKIIP